MRKSIDKVSYKIRFTPRKPSSIWSAVNVARIRELMQRGLVRPMGVQAFERRSDEKTAVYSFERKEAARLDEAEEREFRANGAAWSYFESQPAGYRKTALHWIVSAKKEETRRKRLAQLIADSEQGRTIKMLTRNTKQK